MSCGPDPWCRGEHLFSDCSGGHAGGYCAIHKDNCQPVVLPDGDMEDLCRGFAGRVGASK